MSFVMNENPSCPECSGKTQKRGPLAGGKGHRYWCTVCHHPFSIKVVHEATRKADSNSKTIKVNSKENILVFSCTHLPYEKPGYLEFLKETQKRFNCKTVVSCGDLIDNHGLSFHDHDVNHMSAGQEIDMVKEKVDEWAEAFPNLHITIGNHDALPYRQALSSGLPMHLFKDLNEIYGTPKTWKWAEKILIDDILFIHGTGKGGENIGKSFMTENRRSVVVGHLHTVFSCGYSVSDFDRLFYMSVGCGVDDKAYSMAYAKFNGKKPAIGCGVILQDGGVQIPLLVPMDL